MSGSAHKTLGISSNASPKDIKQAYRKASLKTHPDVKGGSKEAFNKVNDAYNELINNTNHSRVNPHRRAPTHQDGTYTSSDPRTIAYQEADPDLPGGVGQPSVRRSHTGERQTVAGSKL